MTTPKRILTMGGRKLTVLLLWSCLALTFSECSQDPLPADNAVVVEKAGGTPSYHTPPIAILEQSLWGIGRYVSGGYVETETYNNGAWLGATHLASILERDAVYTVYANDHVIEMTFRGRVYDLGYIGSSIAFAASGGYLFTVSPGGCLYKMHPDDVENGVRFKDCAFKNIKTMVGPRSSLGGTNYLFVVTKNNVLVRINADNEKRKTIATIPNFERITYANNGMLYVVAGGELFEMDINGNISPGSTVPAPRTGYIAFSNNMIWRLSGGKLYAMTRPFSGQPREWILASDKVWQFPIGMVNVGGS